MHLPTIMDLQEYGLDTMFVAMSGFEQHTLNSSMPGRRLRRRMLKSLKSTLMSGLRSVVR
jgi:hypothetical protein